MDSTLPKVTSTTPLVGANALNWEEKSIWLKGVGMLFNIQEMVGVGTPSEMQVMFLLTPSIALTVPLLTVVLEGAKT